ncbi:MAG: ABC transporter substrate-binding protein, partial [Betaproteobacteria bacterium]|nr:ABC transporter substrate-binding protein [Betaproteobacteria bacterium]
TDTTFAASGGATAAGAQSRRAGIVVMAAILAVAPFVVYPVFVMNALCFALFASAFNLLIGFGGLLSFGHAMFLGTAGYLYAYSAKVWGFPPEFAILTGTAAAALLGLLTGIIAIRRAGIYFAMITLALAQMMYFFYLQAPFTHGEDGIQEVPRGKLFGLIDLQDTLALYFVVLAIFLGGFLLIYRIVHSPFGQVLKAIRENEARAISLGYKTHHYKLMAFVLSAALSGLAGATKVLVFQLASLTDVHWTMSGEVVLMTLLGGLGTIFGPVVGSFVIVSMQNYLAETGQWVTISQGVIFVVCVLAFRRGIVGGLAARIRIPVRLRLKVSVEPPAPLRTAKLGMVSSNSGSLALLGRAGIEGARIAVAELNAAGGVLDAQVQLLVRDDAGDAEAGAQEARSLIVNDGVAVLLGPVSSAILLPMSEMAREHKTLLISHTANSERAFVERGHRYIFSVVPNTFIEGSAVAVYLAQKPYRRYLVLGPDYELGHLEAAAFERRLRRERPDIEVVGRLWPKLGEADYGPWIAQILAVQPEAVYANLYGADLVEFTRQARAPGLFERVQFTGLYDVEALQALGKDAVEGVIGYDRGPFHVIRQLAPSARFEAFIRQYGAATNKYPSTWAINAYDAVMAWAAAARTTGTLETESVVNALEQLELPSLRGPGRYIRKVDHQANVGTYIGVVAWDPEFPDFAIWKDPVYIAGDQVWRSEQEVLGLLGGQPAALEATQYPPA